jgi:septal ring factor EnvC (AmiA/AmiB activator)
MGQDPGTGSAAVTQAQDPEELQREIEHTREELGDTVEQLAAKADVKAQAKQKLEDTKATVAEKKDQLLGKAMEASPDSATTAATQASQKARENPLALAAASQKARENPLALAAAGAFAFGFLAGRVSKR